MRVIQLADSYSRPKKFSWTAQIWKMQAARFFNMSLTFHQSTRHKIPGDLNLYQQHW